MSFKEFLKEQPEEQISTQGNIIDIYFNNLDEITQKKIFESILKEKNASENDDFANRKITDGLSKTPLISITASDITNKIKFDL
jgi:hypothetical protein